MCERVVCCVCLFVCLVAYLSDNAEQDHAEKGKPAAAREDVGLVGAACDLALVRGGERSSSEGCERQTDRHDTLKKESESVSERDQSVLTALVFHQSYNSNRPWSSLRLHHSCSPILRLSSSLGFIHRVKVHDLGS